MATKEPGAIKAEFKPSRANLIAGIILGVLMIVVGCVMVCSLVKGVMESGGSLPFWSEGRLSWHVLFGKEQQAVFGKELKLSWAAVGIYGVIGVAGVIGGLFLIRWVRSLFSLEVYIGAIGFAVIDKKTTRVHHWDEIESVQEVRHISRPTGAAMLVLPKDSSKRFSITIRESEPFVFDGDMIKEHTKLAQMIKEETDRRNIPWEIVEEIVETSIVVSP